ncbi:MFS general substrate transporter [Pseudovirgaria hyperparasitica]|uniref:MFS general substrate transporter n=1 Tax=Pseudovirgaria hyperparasitica TaxID=470096 RepID=A0A6A6WED9_9PEZI|nr:MFS general substrate transporter [Pseudovirgaria hyperparasitica]KAF2760246.1 MFS general substrate transporter [Pseudovirgaria hyperparasitica]
MALVEPLNNTAYREPTSKTSSLLDSHFPVSDQHHGGEEEKTLESNSTPQRISPRLESIRAPGDVKKPTLSRNQSNTTNSLRPVRSQRSYAGQDGYTCFSDEDGAEGSDGINEPSDPEKAFEVKWDGEKDPMNPRNKGKLQKWLIVLIIAASSLCVTCVSSGYTSIYEQVIPLWSSSREVATLGLSLYVVGLGLGPMFLAPLSEASQTFDDQNHRFYGRRPIYIASLIFFVIWLIPCAVANGMATMLVSRFLDGVAGSAFLSVAGGTVGDMFSKSELSMPMMVYTASPFIGPELGPIIGGFINQYTNWRWTFYTLLIWAGVQLGLIVFFVPETYHPVLLRAKAQKMRADTGNDKWMAPIEHMDRTIAQTILWSCIRPFQLLFLEPMCLCLCILSALLLGILYLFFGAYPLVFGVNHGFTLSQTGLAFIGILIGMIAGISTDPLWRQYREYLVRQREQQGGEPGGSEPEYRLPPTILGAILIPVSLFGFGWTTYSFLPCMVVLELTVSCRIIFVYSGVFTFLVDCYPLYAASALAANSFARSSFAAAFPLFGVQMYSNLGYQWATSLLAFLALAMTPFPYLFYRFGKRLRGKSKFAQA